jgi:hypothetical protein
MFQIIAAILLALLITPPPARGGASICFPSGPIVVCKDIGPPPSWQDEPREQAIRIERERQRKDQERKR